MKAIGFADLYLSEWHANHYPAWIEKVCAKLGSDYRVAYAWAEKDISPVDGKTTDEWCEKFGVTRCATLNELCEKSDCLIILAPSDPQVHLAYARTVMPYGKPTYIDKTFAPDAATAEKIFALSAQYGTPFFSTSALRFATEPAQIPDVPELTLTGGGSNLPEYIIHLAEQAVVLSDSPMKTVTKDTDGEKQIFTLTSESGKKIRLVYSPDLPFTAEWDGGRVDLKSDFFGILMEEIVKFFETRIPPFDPAQTKEVMRVRDAILAL